MYNNPNPNRPDFEEQLKKMRRNIGRVLPIIIVIVIAIVLAADCFYSLNTGEEAVVLRWGRYDRTENDPGLKWKMPFAETKHVVNVEGIQRLQFGSQSNASGGDDFNSQALMLTQEENLVLADWVIQYRISDSYSYLFNVRNPESVLQTISESAYRRVAAAHPLDDILTNKKDDMQREIMADLQDICNKYKIGVLITAVQLQDASPPDEVSDAFLDVTRALEDKNAKQNEARRYENENLPVARGEAVALVNEAEGYKEQRINDAEGSAARYKAIEAEYRTNPGITRTRLYLEMIREVLPGVKNIYFVDGDSNLLEFLPLGGGKNTGVEVPQ